MTLGELFEETYIQGEIAIRSYDSTGTTIEHYLGDGEDDVSSFTLNPSWLSCEDETQRCIMVEIYLEP